MISDDVLGYGLKISEQSRAIRACDLQTHRADPSHIMAILGYDEMVALAGMFERWALTDDTITPDQRTALIEMSSDLEAIATFCGKDWLSPEDDEGNDVLPFLAQAELRHLKGST